MSDDPILLWIIGSASGFVLGLVGAGGGIISIPLLIELEKYSIKRFGLMVSYF